MLKQIGNILLPISKSNHYNVKIVRTDIDSAQIYVNGILKQTFTNISWLSDDIHLSSPMWEGSSNTNGKSVITNFKVKQL